MIRFSSEVSWAIRKDDRDAFRRRCAAGLVLVVTCDTRIPEVFAANCFLILQNGQTPFDLKPCWIEHFLLLLSSRVG